MDGVGLHWYEDLNYEPEVLKRIQEEFKDKFLLNTEACEGVGEKRKVILGSWQRGERYASQIIEVR